MVKAPESPTGHQWDNFAQCMRTFHASYCHYEGLSRSSKLGERVLLYFCHGHFDWATKKKVAGSAKKKVDCTRIKPIIFFLHKKMIHGRSRFVQGVEEKFMTFIKVVRDNEWENYLMDKGEGTAPIEYLVHLELGLRAYSDDVHAFGTMPLRSRTHWSKVSLWRKREAYIAVARYLLDMPPGYKQWDCFLWSDYTSRQLMHKTYVSRHHPLSDGNDELHFGCNMKFDWSRHTYKPRGKRATCPTPAVKPEPVMLTRHAAPPLKPMLYDVDNDCFVEFD